MKAIVALAVLLTSAIALEAPSAHAQEATFAALEGHVFDAKTLRPLPFAYIEYEVQLPSGPGGGLESITDANGFYAFQFLPPFEFPTSMQFYAVCKTRKGNVRVDGLLYYPIRTERYRRDFYVTLPKGITKCIP